MPPPRRPGPPTTASPARRHPAGVRALDFFAGAGGWTEGARRVGVEVVYAANHWVKAVDTHRRNHPGVRHVCQNVDLIDLTSLPPFDLLIASPSCQGSSRARGKERPHHDAERASAWVVPQVLVTCRPRWVVVENVVEMRDAFAHYEMWRATFTASGYSVAESVLNASEFGVPQDRERLFVVASRDGEAPRVRSPRLPPLAFEPFVDWEAGRWNPVADKVEATRARVARAVADGLGDRFLIPYYGSGSGLTGRSVRRPVGTMTALARWAAVKRQGRRLVMRMLSVDEVRRAMGFPDSYLLPSNKRDATRLLGNAVVPHVAAEVIAQVLGASPGWALARGWGLGLGAAEARP